MKIFTLKFYFLCSLIIACFSAFADAGTYSPLGYWRTIDDHTHQPAGIMTIWQDKGILYGKVEKIFPQGGNKPTDLCKNCPGAFHNKPIQGLTVLWGLHQENENTWDGGWIMDPKIGKIYRCKIQVQRGGAQLIVRGYIGISLLGRSQYWDRIPNPQTTGKKKATKKK